MSLPVFDIVRGSMFDGPGIRSVVFMQGCPLHCVWCHNPESQVQGTQNPNAREYTPDELCEILLRDKSYYDVSNGGVTFSGGEPLIHITALQPLVRRLYEAKISVAFDTSGFFDFTCFAEQLLPYTSLVLFDLKIMNPAMHQKYTGKSSDIVQRNLRQLVQAGVPVLIRIPLIPEVTATEDNLEKIAGFMAELGLTKYELVPYNPSCITKLRKLGQAPHGVLSEKPMTQAEEQACQKILDKIPERVTKY